MFRVNIDNIIAAIVLLALVPMMVTLWHAFAAAAGGNPDAQYFNGTYWVLDEVVNNTDVYWVDEDGVILVADAENLSAANNIAIIYNNGTYASWNSTEPGDDWKAAIILVKGSVTEGYGSFADPQPGDSEFRASATAGPYLRVFDIAGTGYHGYYNWPAVVYVFRPAPPLGAGSLVDAMFIVFLIVVPLAVAARIARG